MDRPIHSSSMVCLVCGYGLAGVPYGPCPECGEAMRQSAVEMVATRDALVGSTTGTRRSLFMTFGAVVLFYSAGTWFFAERSESILVANGMVVVCI